MPAGPPSSPPPAAEAAAPRRRRLGVMGTVVGVGLLLLLPVAVARLASTSGADARHCRGVPVDAGAGHGRPEEALEALAGSVRLARWQTGADEPVALPPSGWLRRTRHVYERSLGDGLLARVDLAEADARWHLAGLWVCAPADAVS